MVGISRSNPLTINNFVAKSSTTTGNTTLEPYGILPDVDENSSTASLFLVKYGL